MNWPGWKGKRPQRHKLLGIGWNEGLAKQVWAAAFASKEGRDLGYADGVVAELEKQLKQEEDEWDVS